MSIMIFFRGIKTVLKSRSVEGLPNDISIGEIVLRDIIPFASGAILAKVADYLVAWRADDETSRSLILVITALILILSAFLVRVSTLTRVLRKSKAQSVFMSRDYYIQGKLRKNAFALCTSAVLRARKSIVVMGPHFEGVQVSQDEQSSHDTYLEEGIGTSIDRHIEEESSDFRYERIIQLGSDSYRHVKDRREMTKDLLGNKSMAEHIHDMLSKSRKSHGVEITFHARRYVPSFPSTLVIDDRYVFFSLPTNLISEDIGDQNGARTQRYDVVLGIEDLTGEIPRLFRQMILQFKKEGVEIENIAMD